VSNSTKLNEQAIALSLDPRVHEPGGWADLVVGEHPEPTPAMLAAIERAHAKARDYRKAREESFRRCDTDGFLTQYFDGISSDEERLRAKLLAHGGFDTFPTLFDRHTGEQVRAKLIEGEWGWSWAFLDDGGRRTGRYIPDSRQSKRCKLWKQGFVVLGAWHPARATITGVGTGLSGQAWATTVKCELDEREGAQVRDAA
jgi:hypothetical protein